MGSSRPSPSGIVVRNQRDAYVVKSFVEIVTRLGKHLSDFVAGLIEGLTDFVSRLGEDTLGFPACLGRDPAPRRHVSCTWRCTVQCRGGPAGLLNGDRCDAAIHDTIITRTIRRK